MVTEYAETVYLVTLPPGAPVFGKENGLCFGKNKQKLDSLLQISGILIIGRA